MAFAPMFFRLDKGYTEVNIQGDGSIHICDTLKLKPLICYV